MKNANLKRRCSLLLTLCIVSLAGGADATEKVFYLHSGVEGLFLDTNAPTALNGQIRASPPVSSASFVEIGTWSAGAATAGVDLTALSDLHVWLEVARVLKENNVRLKETDKNPKPPKKAKAFDLRAEILSNGQVIASGYIANISQLKTVSRKGDSKKAKEIVVAFSELSASLVNPGDVLLLRLLVRAVEDRGKPTASPGLRVLFDEHIRPSKFGATFRPLAEPPAISISSITVNESAAGTTNATFSVSLSKASSQFVTINYSTSDGTATAADSDYEPTNGTITFQPGETNKTISIAINGDTLVELDETLYVNFSSPSNATLAIAQGTVTIRNDDFLPAISRIAAGYFHTVVLREDGTLWACGDNGHGQLGDGTAGNKSKLQPIESKVTWNAVAVGYFHTLALSEDGTLMVWGRNDYGQLGEGTFVDKLSPQPIQTNVIWKGVAAGYLHSVALREDGTLWMWGDNNYGQLGDGTFVNKLTPQPIQTNMTWKAVAAGGLHTVALRSDGTLWAWGYNFNGQLGDGTIGHKPTPQPIQTNMIWKAVAAGYSHTVALREDGTIWAWGQNDYGQLGDGTLGNKNKPQPIQTNVTWKAVAAGGLHTVALREDGTLWSWGDNYFGQLGDGTTVDKLIPQPVHTNVIWKAVAAGYSHTVAVCEDGELRAWGNNGSGQLGDGTFESKNQPQPGLGGAVCNPPFSPLSPQIVAAASDAGLSARPSHSLRFISVTVLKDGNVELKHSGKQGSQYIIEASTNLLDWAPLGTNTATSDTIHFTDTSATNFNFRFYRAVQRP